MSDLRRRLDRLHVIYGPPPCPACHGHPSRLVGIDEATDQSMSETMPETGCRVCGKRPHRTLYIVGLDVSEL